MMKAIANSAAVRFIRLGWPGLAGRVARLSEPVPAEDDRVLKIIEASRIIRLVEGASQVVARSARRSRAGQAMAGVMNRIDQRSAGVAMIIAALVHVMLVSVAGDPSGNLWLMLPIMFAVIGALLVATSGRGTAASHQ